LVLLAAAFEKSYNFVYLRAKRHVFRIRAAMWPVFGFLTPLILLLLFMGFVFTTHFIPYFGG